MFNTLRDKFGMRFLGNSGRGFAAAIPVAEGVTITTSNPDTFTRLTGQKVKDKRAKPKFKRM